MALTRPTLLQIASFDATKDQAFKFNVEAGGSQIVANKLTIRNQTGNEVVYDVKQTSFKYEHILPADSLKNGQYYNAVVTVFDSQGNESAPSRPIQFRCYTEPQIKFTNIPISGIINNSSYSFEFQYTQTEGERLGSYVVNLYDITQRLVSTSGTVYVANGTPPFKAEYLFTGFIDDSGYYVEVIGTTINGAVVSTGKIQVNIDYERPDLFTLLALENNCQGGYITVSSNIILIDGVSQPDPPIYIDDKEIDLTGADAFVCWPQGYAVDSDFLARAWFRNPNDWKPILIFSNANGKTIKINFMKGYEEVDDQTMKAYLQVVVSSIDGLEYYIISNYIDPLAEDKYYSLQLKRVNNIYEVKLIAVDGGVL